MNPAQGRCGRPAGAVAVLGCALLLSSTERRGKHYSRAEATARAVAACARGAAQAERHGYGVFAHARASNANCAPPRPPRALMTRRDRVMSWHGPHLPIVHIAVAAGACGFPYPSSRIQCASLPTLPPPARAASADCARCGRAGLRSILFPLLLTVMATGVAGRSAQSLVRHFRAPAAATFARLPGGAPAGGGVSNPPRHLRAPRFLLLC